MHDEELPPYSVLAPKSSIKRRKKEDFSQEEPLELKSIDKDIKKMTDHKNCPNPDMGECIWLQNVSQVPVFVTSPTLEPFPQVPDNSKTSRTGRFDDEYKNVKTSLNGKDIKIPFQLVNIVSRYCIEHHSNIKAIFRYWGYSQYHRVLHRSQGTSWLCH